VQIIFSVNEAAGQDVLHSRFTSMVYANHDMRQQCLIVILVYQVTV